MKLYKNLVNSIATTLQEIFVRNRYADKALERLFKSNPQYGSRDRRFIAEGVYEIVRYYRYYSTLAESANNFWFMTGIYLLLKEIEIPDWPEFKHLDERRIRELQKEADKNPVIKESYADWFWEMCSAELGDEKWKTEAAALNQPAPVFLRTNTLKTTRSQLKEKLQLDRIETTELAAIPEALQLVKRENVFQNKWFREGFFEVQDAGSQLISEFLKPAKGEFIIDACAGAGGKSLHLAALMQNKGRVMSFDVEEWKLEELKKRARRAGAHNIETHVISASATAQYKEKADRLLLDVPCSGSGVLKRNPDAKWKLTKEVIERTKKIQESILTDYPAMLKSGGIMVYSTCSILPSENQLQVRNFLSRNSDFALLEEKTIFPSEGYDGFYMARLQKS